jgi:ribosomal protein S18 acetylase RimI-like enzyme
MTTITAPGAGPAALPRGATSTAVPGLLLRPARWPEEAGVLVDVNNATRISGGSLAVLTIEGFRAYYDNLLHCDLAADLRIAEVAGRPVGYGRVQWRDEHRGDRTFDTAAFRTPDAPAGTFAALLDWALARHRSNAATAPPDGRRSVVVAQTYGDDAEAVAALRERGFTSVRFSHEMLRPSLDDIPDRPLPDGVELRPVEPGHLRAIFEAEVEAFAGHWGASAEDGSDASWRAFLAEPLNRQTDLWQVAWAGDEIVGMVRPFVSEEENARLGVRRGWCENISTRAAWRGRGVASALIGRALRALRDRGMTEAALGVDAQNETGALRLYESMGFRAVFTETEWRRPLVAEPGTSLPDRPGAAVATTPEAGR